MIATAIKQLVSKCTIFTQEHKKSWEDLEEEERDWDQFKTYFIKKMTKRSNIPTKLQEEEVYMASIKSMKKIRVEMTNYLSTYTH